MELSLPNESLLVLIIDELDRLQLPIEEGHLDHDLLPYMRSLMQHRSRLTFVLAGSRRLKEDFWQLVFNAGENFELTALNRRDTERLIREPVQPLVRYDDLAVEHIWRATMGHPYLTQLICHRLIQDTDQEGRRLKVITIDQVQQVIQRILEEDDGYLMSLWHDLGEAERQVLISLADLQGPGDEDVPYGAIIPLEGNMAGETGLTCLLKRGLVKRQASPEGSDGENYLSEDSFGLAYGLLRRWVAQKGRLATTSGEMVI